MKKTGFILLFILIMTILFPLATYADTAPKPSVVINFSGIEGETYYVTLLSREESTGPYSVIDRYGRNDRYNESDDEYDIFLKFAEYHDVDGYYFLQFFDECTNTHQFSWVYYPPQTFKILLYFPKTDRFIVSDTSYEQYAFDSYFTAKVSNTDICVQKTYDYTNEGLSLFARIILTLIVEIGLALLFGFREKRQILFITLVNLITQIALNLALNNIINPSWEFGFVIFYVLLEVVVFVTEAILYTWYFKKHNIKEVSRCKPIVYALVANTASFVLGLILAYWIPSIF